MKPLAAGNTTCYMYNNGTIYNHMISFYLANQVLESKMSQIVTTNLFVNVIAWLDLILCVCPSLGQGIGPDDRELATV